MVQRTDSAASAPPDSPSEHADDGTLRALYRLYIGGAGGMARGHEVIGMARGVIGIARGVIGMARGVIGPWRVLAACLEDKLWPI